MFYFSLSKNEMQNSSHVKQEEKRQAGWNENLQIITVMNEIVHRMRSQVFVHVFFTRYFRQGKISSSARRTGLRGKSKLSRLFWHKRTVTCVAITYSITIGYWSLVCRHRNCDSHRMNEGVFSLQSKLHTHALSTKIKTTINKKTKRQNPIPPRGNSNILFSFFPNSSFLLAVMFFFLGSKHGFFAAKQKRSSLNNKDDSKTGEQITHSTLIGSTRWMDGFNTDDLQKKQLARSMF